LPSRSVRVSSSCSSPVSVSVPVPTSAIPSVNQSNNLCVCFPLHSLHTTHTTPLFHPRNRGPPHTRQQQPHKRAGSPNMSPPCSPHSHHQLHTVRDLVLMPTPNRQNQWKRTLSGSWT
jgi:hypothetical protein